MFLLKDQLDEGHTKVFTKGDRYAVDLSAEDRLSVGNMVKC